MKIQGEGLDCDLQLSMPDAEGWIRTQVTIQVPNFTGAFSCTIQSGEWQSLIKMFHRLRDALGTDCHTEWTNMEENIALSFTLNRLGHLAGSYTFRPDTYEWGPTLVGKFESDQTSLDSWIRQAEKVLVQASEGT